MKLLFRALILVGVSWSWSFAIAVCAIPSGSNLQTPGGNVKIEYDQTKMCLQRFDAVAVNSTDLTLQDGTPIVLPFGLISYDVQLWAGSTAATVTFTIPDNFPLVGYAKQQDGTFVNLPDADVTFTHDTVNHKYIATVTIADNGPYDENSSDGYITDPGGVYMLGGLVTTNVSVPLSSFGKFLMVFGVLLAGMFFYRRRVA